MTSDELDGLAGVLYDAWREPPSLTWTEILRRQPLQESDQTPHFVRRWRRVALKVLSLPIMDHAKEEST